MTTPFEARTLNLTAFDTETWCFSPGYGAPKIVCGAVAVRTSDDTIDGRLILGADNVLAEATHLLDAGRTLAVAHGAYDFACLGAHAVVFLRTIFRAIREGRVHDVLLAQALDAIYHGHLGLDPRTGGDLKNPKGKSTKRYSLFGCVDLVLGRRDAKERDAWRTSYALLDGVPKEKWPEEAREYPVDDVRNTLEVAEAQLVGGPGEHEWVVYGAHEACVHCGVVRTGEESARCLAWRREPHQNLENLAAQVEFAFVANLGAVWGLRTDGAAVERLASACEEKHQKAVERFQALGWIRGHREKCQPAKGLSGCAPGCNVGTEDQAALKRAVALAYGASGSCGKCGGSGRVRDTLESKCRGEKLRGRYQGCSGSSCALCGGVGRVQVLGPEKVCAAQEDGCAGTGLVLDSATSLPKTEKGDVSTSRDTLMESGDDDLADYGDDEFEKVRSTYVPFLRQGTDRPITLSPNPLLVTGRCSYDGPIQLLPRKGGVRECFRARAGYLFCSTDYAAGELCSLAAYTNWVVGESKMLELINETEDPGSLHTMLGARMLGVTFEEMRARVKADDKQAKDFRQASKCFHPDTEILTRGRGWVRIVDLTMEDEVASVVPKEERPASKPRDFDPVTGSFLPAKDGHDRRWWKEVGTKFPAPSMEVVWTKPLRLTSRKASEGLLHIKNYSIDLRVTPDHRMLTYGGTKLLKTVEARDFGKQRGWFNAGMWNGGEIDVDERILRLAVATQANGSYSIPQRGRERIKFGFSKHRKIDRMQAMLLPGEYSHGVSKNGRYRPTTWFNLTEELAQRVKSVLDRDKTFPWWWLELTPSLRAAVLDETAFWDAHRGERMRCHLFHTVIKKNTEVLQAIAAITKRKATYTGQDRTVRDNEQTIYTLSVKTKHDTRGENVEITKLDYDGDVYCLTVPSSYVIVRDGGIPVVSGQCANFGFPGGLGPTTLVLTNRRKAAGETKLPDGTVVAGIRFCVLLGGAEKCGSDKITEWRGRPCPPVCKQCVDLADSVLKRTFFSTFPEVRAYLDFVGKHVEKYGSVPQYAWNEDVGEREVLRVRGGVGFCDAANQGFQGLLADIGKRAFCAMVWEGYLGVKVHVVERGEHVGFLGPDRRPHVMRRGVKRQVEVLREAEPSPLAGARFPIFLHDEPFGELPEASAHLAGPRIAEIMVEAGKALAPDVFWKAEPALMRAWYKEATPRYNSSGRLIPWEPKEKRL